MFTVLRRFSILMTMMMEYWLLQKTSTFSVKISVFLMIFGAVIAASRDLTFDLIGYMMVLGNDLLTACNGVVLKKKLNEAKELGEFGLLFFNTLFSLPVLIIMLVLNQENDLMKVKEFFLSDANDSQFQIIFLLASVMGFVINYSIFLCTKINSALTTTVIGCLKNVLTTYLGMLMGDYVFESINFLGLNVSIVGSLFYSYEKYSEQMQMLQRLRESSNDKKGMV